MKNKRNNSVGEKAHATGKPLPPEQDKAIRLVKRAIGGDFAAFGDLYGIYLDRIYRYVFYQVKDKMTAEDITEEVFLKAWKAINSCKGKEQTFSSWLYRIAHNRVIDIFRSQRKAQTIDMETVAELHHPTAKIETELDHQEILDGVADLPPNQRQVIILKFIEDLDNREIERIIGKSQGAIRVLQTRALAKLREKLSNGREK
ncbi:MAG: RNA polymerase sigma factor [Chloroflexi bacterium]|nr:RNA polymerase sigma factor [Chloroflexota bacterium]